MQRPTLLVLAAGMGSRYGGLKQIDPQKRPSCRKVSRPRKSSALMAAKGPRICFRAAKTAWPVPQGLTRSPGISAPVGQSESS